MERSARFDATGWVCLEVWASWTGSTKQSYPVYMNSFAFSPTIEPRPSSVAQRKRVGLITQRSEDRNLVELSE